MPKLGMAPIRRKQLVEAAIAAIHEHGFANATVARIVAASPACAPQAMFAELTKRSRDSSSVPPSPRSAFKSMVRMPFILTGSIPSATT